jgi:Cu/Ag efflux pump CusA
VATEVVVRYAPGGELGREELGLIRVPTAAGASVPLGALAESRPGRAPNYIMRENVRRRVVVTANIAGGDLQSLTAAMREALHALDLPPGVHLELAGQFEQEAAATKQLLLLALLVIVGIALIVGATVQSIRRTAIVLVNLPLALAGGVVGVYAAGGVMSIATTIGFITLFGIATRNGILLATRTRDLEAQGVPTAEASITAAGERLAPILMTAVTAALGLWPLAMALGEPGAEIQAPMALVILAGLTTSTLLNLVVVPALLVRYGGPRQDRRSTGLSVPPGDTRRSSAP